MISVDQVAALNDQIVATADSFLRFEKKISDTMLLVSGPLLVVVLAIGHRDTAAWAGAQSLSAATARNTCLAIVQPTTATLPNLERSGALFAAEADILLR